MFTKEAIKFKPYIENEKLGFKEDIKKLSWSELSKYGIIKESSTIDDDTVILSKTFVSNDKSLTREDKIIISKDNFIKYKDDILSPHQVNMEINRLTSLLNISNKEQRFEDSAEIRDKITFLNIFYKNIK